MPKNQADLEVKTSPELLEENTLFEKYVAGPVAEIPPSNRLVEVSASLEQAVSTALTKLLPSFARFQPTHDIPTQPAMIESSVLLANLELQCSQTENDIASLKAAMENEVLRHTTTMETYTRQLLDLEKMVRMTNVAIEEGKRNA